MKLNRKLWTAALAVAMTTPSAMAAQDTAGMHYTSAAEGFYASIRVRYVSNDGHKDNGADLQDGSSRFGVRGTNDLGGGLEGFYQYEAAVSPDQGGGLKTRLGHVGLRGDFGSVVAGAFWPDTYNFVYGATDVANRHSGNMTGGFGQYRTSKSLQYTTPDLNGFQGALLIQADGYSDGGTKSRGGEEGGATRDGDGNHLRKDESNTDHWSIAAKYDIAGFSTGFSFSRYSDKIGHEKVTDAAMEATAMTTTVAVGTSTSEETGRKDRDSWAFKLGYSQDNWYVNSWYGVISDADGGICHVETKMDDDDNPTGYTGVKCGDTEVFSMAGGISVDKVKVYAVYETRESDYEDKEAGKLKRADNARSTLGVQYTLGSNSWTWVEYAGRDFDTSKTEESDFSIGLGHSF